MFVRVSGRPQARFIVSRFADKNPFVDKTEWKPKKIYQMKFIRKKLKELNMTLDLNMNI